MWITTQITCLYDRYILIITFSHFLSVDKLPTYTHLVRSYEPTLRIVMIYITY
jgi:hypothetical protein